jgi:hypothetical protein
MADENLKGEEGKKKLKKKGILKEGIGVSSIFWAPGRRQYIVLYIL